MNFRFAWRDAPTPAPAPARSLGSCELTVSGAADAKATSSGGLMTVGSEYWLGPADLAAMAERLRDPAARAEFDKREVKTFLFQLNCGDSKAKAMFGVGALPKAQFPMGPGKYKVVSGAEGPGSVNGMFSLAGGKSPTPQEGGVLEITTWDHDKLVGTFDVPTRAGDESFRFQGRFDLTCHTATCGR